MNREQSIAPENRYDSGEIPQGRYSITVGFIKGDGKPHELKLNVRQYSAGSWDDFKSRIISEAVGVGLHNFGMDVSAQEYRAGHPVTFHVKDETGGVIQTFSEKFNASGYVVK